ncbi:hypothetical protein A8V01_18680 [Novosphingobium guangzhouense]|uniref:Outer membrane protein beta-barrel domain-containing protein n=1 Tax=Novosphingobium guangzhouense TaxID=1850347 RepID=A0A2K2G1B5_9SPHN|nr:hypothetical protein A8V01_18680 [Novosphingobium guangzhouense]
MWLSGPLLPLLVPELARAQDHPVEMPETLVEGLEPKGIRLGSVIALPRVNFDLRYDDNIYNRPDKVSDGVAVVRPALALQTDLPRHSLRLDARAEARRYFDTPQENSRQWSLAGSTRLDFAERITLTLDSGIARRIERRGTYGDQFFTDRPVAFIDKNVSARIAQTGGVIEWQASIGTQKVDYRDALQSGVRVDQSFRDVRRDSMAVQVEYRRSTKLGVFVRAVGTRLVYDLGRERNSRGFSVLGGVTYRITDLVSMEAGVGYVKQNIRDPQRPDVSAVDYRVKFSWTPTPRARLELDGARTVERSPLALGATILQSSLVASGSLAVGSRTLVGLEVGFLNNDYNGFDRRETRLQGEFTVSHKLTPNVAAFAGLSGRHQRGSGVTPREYDGFAARIGARIAI